MLKCNSLGPWIALFVCSAITARAQSLTIPEELQHQGHSMGRLSSAPSGPVPTLDKIVDLTDLVVRGVLGESTSYLSEDQTEVYTDYPILNATVLYDPRVVVSKKPEVPSIQPTRVTILGGT